MKDLFSSDSKLYASARPSYPDALISFLLSKVKHYQLAWDAGTGNGQMAVLLAPYFEKIVATDISKQQLANALSRANINYSVQPAEKTLFKDKSINLITIAQAIHWFSFDDFYKEVNRVLSLGGIIAAIGYPLVKVNREVDEVILYLYKDILGDYWDPEREHIDDHYTSIPFPFKEIPLPVINTQYSWTIDQLISFLYTWSALKHYMNKNDKDPLIEIIPLLRKAWGNKDTDIVQFSIFGRIGIA